MGIEALTHTAAGGVRHPVTPEDWRDWVSASSTRNYACDDPLLDWLDAYGEAQGFVRDDQLAGYDPRTDFVRFIFRKGAEFEAAVLRHLADMVSVTRATGDWHDTRSMEKAEATFRLMSEMRPVIYQGVLWDAESRTYGSPDFLVRSDVLANLFPATLSPNEAVQPAPDLGLPSCHYRVLDIKFTTLHFRIDGGLDDGAWPFELQVFVYNRALGRLQGFEPSASYLMGRSWAQDLPGGRHITGKGCMERLGAVPQGYTSRTRGSLTDAVDAGMGW